MGSVLMVAYSQDLPEVGVPRQYAISNLYAHRQIPPQRSDVPSPIDPGFLFIMHTGSWEMAKSEK